MSAGYGTSKTDPNAVGTANPAGAQSQNDAIVTANDTLRQKVTAAGIDLSAGEPAHPIRTVTVGADDGRVIAGTTTAPTVANPYHVATGAPTIAFDLRSELGKRLRAVRANVRADGTNAWTLNVYKINGKTGAKTLLGTDAVPVAAADDFCDVSGLTSTLASGEWIRAEVNTADAAGNDSRSYSVEFDFDNV